MEIVKITRDQWGSEFSGQTFFSLYNLPDRTHLGVMAAKAFGLNYGQHAENLFVSATLAKGNVVNVDPGRSTVTWEVATAPDPRIKILEVKSASQFPGRGGEIIELVIDASYVRKNMLLLTAGAFNAPMLRVVEDVRKHSGEGYVVRLKVQDGNPNSYVRADYIQPDKYLVDASTSTPNELNYDYAGLSFGGKECYESTFGQVSRGVKFTDRFLRLEKEAAKNGRMPDEGYDFLGRTYKSAVSQGYVLLPGNPGEDPTVVERGVFVTSVEKALLERIMLDKELLMRFGRYERGIDPVSNTEYTVAPGWHQWVRNGEYRPHPGDLTLDTIEEIINSKFLLTRDFPDRKIVLRMGTGMLRLWNQWIQDKAAASPFTVVDSSLAYEMASSIFHQKSLTFGFQFTGYRAVNGTTFLVAYDPMKDDQRFYQEKVPGTNLPVESFCIDILDFGSAGESVPGAMSDSNIMMVQDPSAHEHYWVSGVYDPVTGAINDGGTTQNPSKECQVRIQSTCGLLVVNPDRIGRFELQIQ